MVIEFESPKDFMEHQAMSRVANAHEVQDFLTGLTADQLKTMSMLLLSFADPESGAFLAAQHHGMVIQIRALKHDNCVCGHEHEDAEALLGDVGSPHPEGTGEEYSDPPSQTLLMENLPAKVGLREFDEPIPVLMDRYRLLLDGGVLRCRDCGLQYISLKDRMIKEPDDCHGCHLKNSQG